MRRAERVRAVLRAEALDYICGTAVVSSLREARWFESQSLTQMVERPTVRSRLSEECVGGAEAGYDRALDGCAREMISAHEDAVDFAKGRSGRSADGWLLGQGALDPVGAEVPPAAHFRTEPRFEFREDLLFQIRDRGRAEDGDGDQRLARRRVAGRDIGEHADVIDQASARAVEGDDGFAQR